MAKYTVMVNMTRTIERSVELEISAKDEESAETKATEKIEKLVSDGKLDSLDWEDNSDEDSFEYEVNEA